MLNKVIVIVGPTAVGKSEFAINLARNIKGEIISADSMQAYKGMGLISQSPTASERKRAPHHLVNFLNPEEEYNAAMFAGLAEKKIKNIIRRKKAPIVVGGSGLYVKALINGIFPSKGKDEALRERLRAMAREKGPLYLYERLAKIDHASAERIHPNDLKKVIRALEIYELEKKTKENLKIRTQGIGGQYDVRIFGLTLERKKLYEKINGRVDLMFKKGIVGEVKRLLCRKLSLTSKEALGIKELKGYLDGIYGLEKAKDMLKRNTRRFAKRQLTWFRADGRIAWVDMANGDYGKSITRNIKT